jgi:hypothetical protein
MVSLKPPLPPFVNAVRRHAVTTIWEGGQRGSAVSTDTQDRAREGVWAHVVWVLLEEPLFALLGAVKLAGNGGESVDG